MSPREKAIKARNNHFCHKPQTRRQGKQAINRAAELFQAYPVVAQIRSFH